MQVFILLYNAGTDNEGIHTIKTGDINQVQMFASENDATTFSLLLESQNFPKPSVEMIDDTEVKEFCRKAGYTWNFVPAGKLVHPPAANLVNAVEEALPNKNLNDSDFTKQGKDKSKVTIFLAHASEDKQDVRKLYRKLKQCGYRPWLDEEDILPGQLWREEIPKAIRTSDFFLACLSKQSVAKSGYVQREFRLALNYYAERPTGYIYLIPLKLDDCEIPDLRHEEYGIALRDYQWLNYHQADGFERLLRTIEYQRIKI